MAHIDNLIESIKDPLLRAALKAEYDKVTKNRRLGLVFDRHLPESVALPGFAIHDGEKVQVLADGTDDPADVDGTGIWTVTSLNGGTAQLRDGDGDTRQAPVEQLVATREFGDPIYPGLVSTGTVVRGSGTDGDDGGKPFHTVINAENYHALEALLFAHEGQIDAIYIDPPYNTGARDWKYNNDYVDDSDPYRHSKWLSFIERRLVLAKRLLRPDKSVLIVAIDENEVNRLGLLVEQVFPSASVQMVTTIINPRGKQRQGAFARSEDYLFFVLVGSSQVAGEPDLDYSEGAAVPWRTLRRSDIESRRGTSKGGTAQFYPIYVDVDSRRIVEVGAPLSHGVDRTTAPAIPGAVPVFPIRNDGTEMNWGLTGDSLRSLISEGFVRVGRSTPDKPQRYEISYLTSGKANDIRQGRATVTGRDETGAVIAHYVTHRLKMPTSVWSRDSHNAEVHGTEMLKALLGGAKSFPYPKSLYAVEDCLRFFLSNRPDALVLDFFAGSGTTAHAVMRLNRQDGGRRRAILVTNNEVSADEQATLRARGLAPGDAEWEALGICDYITKPRVRAAITGTTPTGQPVRGEYRFVDEFPMAEGFAENAEFFTLTYEDPSLVSLGRRFEAIAPLLWLRAGAAGERINNVTAEGWTIPTGAVYGVLFDTAAWGPFVSAAAKREDLTHAYIVTDSIVEYQQIVAKLDPTIKTTRLYADYLRSFAINTSR